MRTIDEFYESDGISFVSGGYIVSSVVGESEGLVFLSFVDYFVVVVFFDGYWYATEWVVVSLVVFGVVTRDNSGVVSEFPFLVVFVVVSFVSVVSVVV